MAHSHKVTVKCAGCGRAAKQRTTSLQIGELRNRYFLSLSLRNAKGWTDREVHVSFCDSVRVKIPVLTRLPEMLKDDSEYNERIQCFSKIEGGDQRHPKANT